MRKTFREKTWPPWNSWKRNYSKAAIIISPFHPIFRFIYFVLHSNNADKHFPKEYPYSSRFAVVAVSYTHLGSYEPDPSVWTFRCHSSRFRSTGSYEPDLPSPAARSMNKGFDPQALTSLTYEGIPPDAPGACFDPQALTSLTGHLPVIEHVRDVSIHRLLRA